MKFLLKISPLYLFFIPILLYAEDYTTLANYDGYLDQSITSGNGGFSNYLNTVMGIMIALAAVAAVVMIVVGGLQYMTTDAVNNKADGKKKITSAIGGLILALSSWLILNTINPNILKFDFGVDNVAKDTGAYDRPNRSVPNYVPGDLSSMTPNEREEWLKKNAEDVNPEYTGNIQVTTFGGPYDSGVTYVETGSVTGERLKNLDPNTDYYIAYPLYGHNIKGLPQLAGGNGAGTGEEIAATNKALNDFYIEIEANGKTVRARIIDRGPSQGNNITNGHNKLDASSAVWEALGVRNGSTGSLSSVKLVPKSGSSGLVN